MQIIVLGMHRSGTSALARCLNLMGAYFGPEGISTGANQENPRGFWERRDVRALNDAVLNGVGCDWNRVSKFDLGRLPASLLADFEEQASGLLLEMDAHRPWFIKEPRLCLLLPLWLKLLDAPLVIHILRHPAEVAASLQRRNAMPISAGFALWERYVRDALSAARGLPALLVSHQRLMVDPCAEVEVLFNGLQRLGVQGLHAPGGSEVRAFMREDLYHERGIADPAYADAPQVHLFERLIGGGDPADVISQRPSPGLAEILAGYEAGLPLLQPRRPPESHAALHERIVAREQEVRSLRERVGQLEKELVRRDERLGRELVTLGELRANLKQRDDALRALRSEQQRAAAAQRAEQERANAALRKAEQSVEARFKEIAELTRLLMTGDQQLEEATGTLESTRQQLELVQAELNRARQQLDAMLASRLWRLWEPLRRLRGGRAGMRDTRRDLLRSSSLFDATWYLETYPDVAASGIDAAEHYLEFGGFEQRDPGPDFDSGGYMSRYPDVAEARMNPLLHYLLHGRAEGRVPK